MNNRISAPMQRTLRSAPDEWRKVIPAPSVEALEKRGLVEIRSDPKDSKPTMGGFQWRITEVGKVMDGRICACCRKPPHHSSATPL